MKTQANKIVELTHKTFSVKSNATWKAIDYAEFLSQAARFDTYLETVNSRNLPNADTMHYRITQDTDISSTLKAFLSITKNCLKRLKGRKAVLIIDYTDEPFFGKTRNEWVHGYRPAKGSRGCYKFLAASIIVDEQRYFVYAKPINEISDESFEILQILATVELMGIRIKVVLMDRGISRSSENIAVLTDAGVKYLGLYAKYKNVKKIIRDTKHKYINRKFEIKGVPTRLVLGKLDIHWTFVTNMELSELDKYIKLYKKRWNIETGFRVHDEARIKTKSIDIRVRYFLFIVAMLLYNVWKHLDTQISFKRFVITLWLDSERICRCKLVST